MCFSPKQRSVTRIGPWFVIIKIALKKTKCTLAGAVSVDAQIERSIGTLMNCHTVCFGRWIFFVDQSISHHEYTG
jgi:hypothetical protein